MEHETVYCAVAAGDAAAAAAAMNRHLLGVERTLAGADAADATEVAGERTVAAR